MFRTIGLIILYVAAMSAIAALFATVLADNGMLYMALTSSVIAVAALIRFPDFWAEDHIAITGINGIGRIKNYSICGNFGIGFRLNK